MLGVIAGTKGHKAAKLYAGGECFHRDRQSGIVRWVAAPICAPRLHLWANKCSAAGLAKKGLGAAGEALIIILQSARAD